MNTPSLTTSIIFDLNRQNPSLGQSSAKATAVISSSANLQPPNKHEDIETSAWVKTGKGKMRSGSWSAFAQIYANSHASPLTTRSILGRMLCSKAPLKVNVHQQTETPKDTGRSVNLPTEIS